MVHLINFNFNGEQWQHNSNYQFEFNCQIIAIQAGGWRYGSKVSSVCNMLSMELSDIVLNTQKTPAFDCLLVFQGR